MTLQVPDPFDATQRLAESYGSDAAAAAVWRGAARVRLEAAAEASTAEEIRHHSRLAALYEDMVR